MRSDRNCSRGHRYTLLIPEIQGDSRGAKVGIRYGQTGIQTRCRIGTDHNIRESDKRTGNNTGLNNTGASLLAQYLGNTQALPGSGCRSNHGPAGLERAFADRKCNLAKGNDRN